MIYLVIDEAVLSAQVLLAAPVQRVVEIPGRASGRLVCLPAGRQPAAVPEAGPDARPWRDAVARKALRVVAVESLR
jgi:hypothetical protein